MKNIDVMDSMTLQETAFTFGSEPQSERIGIIHHPDNRAGDVGLLIIVGGPQYRIGAHRQYVHLARHCAAKGIPTMRFDYQGVGDSGGNYPGFEHITGDISEAIEEFLARTPNIKSVAIWGLCEGASAILLGASDHKAISHIVLANPWVRSDSGLAKAYVKHYYLDRLKSPDFWRKIFSGKLNISGAVSGFLSNLKQAFGMKSTPQGTPQNVDSPIVDDRPFPERMRTGLENFQGKALLIQSEYDLVAREFDDLASSDKAWKKAIAQKISLRYDIPDTDHTFSTEAWRLSVAEKTANWILQNPSR